MTSDTILEPVFERELNTLPPTTTVTPCLFGRRIQFVLSLRPPTPVLWPRGVQGILIVMYRYGNEQATRTREKSIKGGAHVCVVGDRANALGCSWLKNYRVIAFKTFSTYIYIYMLLQGIPVVMYSYLYEQAINACVPDQRGTRAQVVGNELNALQMCIWLKTDSIALQQICMVAERVAAARSC